jgi:hypothetical protein
MKHPVTIHLLTALSALTLLATSTQAITIASWDTFGEPGDQVSTAGTGSPNAAADAMVRGPGLIPNAGANSFNSRGWNAAPVLPPGLDLDYVQFGFDVDPGFSVNLDTLIIGTRSSNTGPGTIGVYTSLDGFAVPVATLLQPGEAFVNSVIDLSALGSVTGAFDIRLIEIGNTQADGIGVTTSTGTFRVVDFFDGNTFSDTQITGTTTASIPEGGFTLGLLGLGLASLALARRKSIA